MPSSLTHYVFNKQLIKNQNYENIFLLGGQGADVFFFYGYNLLKRKEIDKIRKFGNDIHAIDPAKLFMQMLRYSFSKKGEEKDILISFTRGFMYHYALDRNMHPYIFYKTGFPYTTKKYNLNHSNMESTIDTLIMKEYGYKVSTRKAIKANNKHVKMCSKMFQLIAKNIFNYDFINEDTYYKAYKDFRFTRLILDSRFGIKKSLFNAFLKETKINAVSQPSKVKDDDKYDYLNKKKNDWIVPDLGIKVNYSVKDMFDAAILDTRIIDNIIYNYKDNIVTQRKLTKFSDNINHDGRHLDKEMTYFKVIWSN